jgi:CRP-like cAMP-binding protein
LPCCTFYFSGKYDIIVGGNLVGNYDSKGSFGELALMYNMPRAATIVATSEGTLSNDHPSKPNNSD